ncbi:MAG TPA: pyridoxamine 5'-phosphate oxidase family protein [Streptosporangiaceae bacterium]|jgi:hypothetical protein|nr:pyridoxamine 5'-phosphate oxidase family protein [Streptosporangiaceae bacterium]
MREQPEDLAWLDQLLQHSRAGSGEHLQSIIRADRTVPAAELVERLAGMHELAVATVSASCRPRVSAVDGHFLRGRWVFTTDATAVKARDLRARPQVSAAYIQGETFAVFTHGDAEFLGPDHPDRGWVEEHLTAHYGVSPSTWGDDIPYIRINPTWMVSFHGGNES